jgi:hypothetical protein
VPAEAAICLILNTHFAFIQSFGRLGDVAARNRIGWDAQGREKHFLKPKKSPPLS